MAPHAPSPDICRAAKVAFWVDAVEKVENQTVQKISRNLIFGRRDRCKVIYSRYERRWSILCEMIWSLTSPRGKRIDDL
jgi:hypothetical protein